MNITGVLVLDKPAGYTSQDAIRVVKGILKADKIGHTGTLDPMATGVLPVCLGKATKAAELIGGQDKAYRASMVFGSETDTEDAEGTVTKKTDEPPDLERVRRSAMSFVGPYEQVPPMYSAIKKDGRKLYQLARSGVTLDLPARKVAIRDLTILALSEKGMTFEVTCSKGTYVRSLCRDIGRRSGALGHMTFLVRTRSGPYTLSDCISLEQLENLKKTGQERQAVKDLNTVFSDEPAFTVPAEDVHYLMSGNFLTYQDASLRLKEGSLVRMLLPDGTLAALYKVKGLVGSGEQEAVRLCSYKMFV